MLSDERLHQIRERHDFVSASLAAGQGDIVALGREYSELEPVVAAIRRWEKLKADLAEARELADDPEMAALAAEDIARAEAELPALEAELKRALLPRDIADTKPAILEIRPGTGGDEAALFAGDLLRMYTRYAEQQGWQIDVIEQQSSDLGGIKEAVLRIDGEGVFAKLKFESGVHRVQRVPETESGGRIHTSAATVAVLPVAEEVDLDIAPADLRIETMRASGAGGQHVNTTDSAVRITHLPTGIVVTSSEKSQHQNRANALATLRARLLDQQRREAADARAADRKAQLGSGDRSERIRTYNFPQGRMTDHRIGLTLYRLDAIMGGDLNEIIDSLIAEDEAARLAELDA